MDCNYSRHSVIEHLQKKESVKSKSSYKWSGGVFAFLLKILLIFFVKCIEFELVSKQKTWSG